jgi:DNA-binding IclR family transcriptional regulator
MLTPRRVARPALEALAQEVGETIFLGVLQESRLLIVDKVEYGQVLRISPALGTTLPLRQTALGQVWLACCPASQRQSLLAALLPDDLVGSPERWLASVEQELTTIRQQGFAVSMETWLPELCCLAAPIQDSSGEIMAALAIALPRSRMPQPQRHDPFTRGTLSSQYPTLVPPLLRTAAQIMAALP